MRGGEKLSVHSSAMRGASAVGRTHAIRGGQFLGNEAALAVRAVTEWFLARLSATTEGNVPFGGINREPIALVIDHCNRSSDYKRSIQTTANGDFTHRFVFIHTPTAGAKVILSAYLLSEDADGVASAAGAVVAADPAGPLPAPLAASSTTSNRNSTRC